MVGIDFFIGITEFIRIVKSDASPVSVPAIERTCQTNEAFK